MDGAVVGGGRCGLGRRRRRRRVEIDPYKRSIRVRDVRNIGSQFGVTVTTALKLRPQAGTETLLGLDLDARLLGLLVGLLRCHRRRLLRSQWWGPGLKDFLKVHERGSQDDQEDRREDEENRRKEHLDRRLHRLFLGSGL